MLAREVSGQLHPFGSSMQHAERRAKAVSHDWCGGAAVNGAERESMH